MDEYLNRLDWIDISNAVYVSGIPKEIQDWIWETKRNPFETWID